MPESRRRILRIPRRPGGGFGDLPPRHAGHEAALVTPACSASADKHFKPASVSPLDSPSYADEPRTRIREENTSTDFLLLLLLLLLLLCLREERTKVERRWFLNVACKSFSAGDSIVLQIRSIRLSEKFPSFYEEITDARDFLFYIVLSSYVRSILFCWDEYRDVSQTCFHVCMKLHCCKKHVCERKTLLGQPFNCCIFKLSLGLG